MTDHTRCSRLTLLAFIALLMGLALAAAGTPAAAQSNDDGTYALELRDGTTLRLKNYDFNATGVTGEDVNLSGVTLRVPWSYVAPGQAVALRAALLGENPTVAQRLELINWARGFEELGEGVRQQLEAVLLRDPGHPAALRIARQMGLAMNDGHLMRDTGNGGNPTGNPSGTPAGNRPPTNGGGATGNQPGPEQPVRPAGPARIALSVTTDVDWSGQYSKFERKPSTSGEEQVRRFFERRGFKIVTGNAEFAIEVFIKVKPSAISEFFDLPVAAEFTGTAAGSVTDRRETTSKRKDIPAIDAKIQRTDVQAALDGVLADLVERIGAATASECR